MAPGLKDVLVTGKIKERVIATNKDGTLLYDAIVVDSPPGRTRPALARHCSTAPSGGVPCSRSTSGSAAST